VPTTYPRGGSTPLGWTRILVFPPSAIAGGPVVRKGVDPLGISARGVDPPLGGPG
jgi:hypothetical protein